MMPLLRLAGIDHDYGRVAALRDIGLEVAKGELLTILGPSGSGKTSLLRVIGGFEMPRRAVCLSLDGIDLRGMPPHRRPIATVFQHYALFPHMNVGDNVGYGLRMRGIGRPERLARAEAMLALMRLPGVMARRIDQLSGGERQRVAFARALVTEPLLLLLDEPMGALDEHLRRALEIEIRALQQRLGTTIVQVTHGREEALSMSDRIVLMQGGRIVQQGRPAELFDRPATRFAADFMGCTNIIEGTLAEGDRTHAVLRTEAGDFHAPWTGAGPPHVGQAAFLAVHPARLRVSAHGAASGGPANHIAGCIMSVGYGGTRSILELASAAGPLSAAVERWTGVPGPVDISWAIDDAAIGPAEIVQEAVR